MTVAPFESLVDVVRRRARDRPEALAYTFLEDGERVGDRLTFGELDLRCRVLAAELQDRGLAGERALLLHPPGLEFAVAFLGCLFAGTIPIPAYPPGSRRHLPRLAGIARDARPAAVLAPADRLERLRSLSAEALELASPTWLAADGHPTGRADDGRMRTIRPDDLAFLQYTSGSTGSPKGVQVTHGNLMHNEEAIHRAFGQSEASVIVSWLPPYHDMGLIGGLLQPLYAGGRCILMAPAAFLQKPLRWLAAISEHGGTTSGGPDFAYRLCVRRVAEEERQGLDLSTWRVAFTGAEPVRADTLDAFCHAFGDRGFRRSSFFPCYGLAEATLFVSGGEVERDPPVESFDRERLAAEARAQSAAPGRGSERLVGCGGACWGQEVLVVDPERRHPVALGAVGEIWVAGPSVAHGYWERPDLTERIFRARLDGRPGETFLRTGDLGFVAGGELFITGRLKDLIILRGRNHHPQDLEDTAERCHQGLRAGGSAAFGVERDGEERLVVVHELERRHRDEPEVIAEAVRAAIAAEHQVAVHAVVLVRPGGVPRTSSGKVQRYACRERWLAGALPVVWCDSAAPKEERSAASDSNGAGPGPLGPARDLEERVCREVARTLGLDPRRLDPDRPLTSLGLDSLAAMELGHALETAFGPRLSLSRLLEGATAASLAATVAAGGSPAPDAGGPRAGRGPHPLTQGQRALWFLERRTPGRSGYHVCGAARLRGGLDPAALEAALLRLVGRHEALRTRFMERQGEPYQEVCSEPAFELSVRERPASGEIGEDVLHAEAMRPFDLAAGPLLRVVVWTGSDGAATLFFAVHHLVVDFWSLALLGRELGSLLSGVGDGDLPAAPAVATAVADEERRIGGAEGERSWRYWRRRLAPDVPLVALPADRRRGEDDGGSRPAGTVRLRLDAGGRQTLERFARERGVTPFSVLATACFAWLSRLTGEEDLTLGTPTTGARGAALAGAVGYLVNPVALRADLSGRPSLEELLARCWRACVEAFDHRDLPFPVLVERLRPPRRPGATPIFQGVLAHQQASDPALGDLPAFAVGEPGGRVQLGPLRLETLAFDEPYARFEWTLRTAEVGGELALSLQYDRRLFDRTTIARWLRHFRRLLVAGLERPDRPVVELPLMQAAEEAQVVREWSRIADRVSPPRPVVERILKVADECPDAVAVIDGPRTLSYRELARRVRALARELVPAPELGERPVALFLGRSAELPVAMLAALAVGRPYVPLDPSDPPARNALILEHSRAQLAVTRRHWVDVLAELAPELPVLDVDVRPVGVAAESWQPRKPRLADGSLAYLLFTSGSTGRPKGVAVSCGALDAYLAWVERDLGSGTAPRDPPLASAPGFDASLKQVFLPLLRGGPVRVLGRESLLQPDRLAEALVRQRATVFNCVPAVWEALLEAIESCDGPVPHDLAAVWLGGDDVSEGLLRSTRKLLPGLRVVNLYGPTETTANATWADLAGEDRVTLGRPAASSPVLLMDGRLRPVAPGVVGELCVGGERLARGYLGAPAVTAAHFVPDPSGGFPGGRLYRTGDLGRHRGDGRLDFKGRMDDQFQLSGLRVEPGEIRAVIEEHPSVAHAAVVAGGVPRRPLAYVVPVAPAAAGDLRDEIRRRLARRFPVSAVPAVLLVDDLPRTASGKVDRLALEAREVPEAAPEEPRGVVEELLCEVWSDLLGAAPPDRHANFFELGGHSLLAGRLISRVRELFSVDLALGAVFECPTPAALGRRIAEARRGAPDPAEAGGPRRLESDLAPLSPGQWRLWFHQKLHPRSAAYNMPGALRLKGALDLGALARALGEVVRRHDVLRSLLVEAEDGPVQQVAERPVLPLPVVGIDALGSEVGAVEEDRLLRGEAARPFLLASEVPLRTLVLRRSAEHHVLAVVLHHVAADAWSLELLLDELAELYQAFRTGATPRLAPLPLQYADYSVWRRERASRAEAETSLEYWRRELSVEDGGARLPSDRPLPSVPSFAGGLVVERLDAAASDALKQLGRRAGASPFMILLAALQVQLARYADHPRPVVGFPVSDRPRIELERLIGFFTNTVVVQADLSGPVDFLAHLARVRASVLTAHEHSAVPFDRVVEALGVSRDGGGAALVQVLFTVAQARREREGLAALETLRIAVHNGTAKTALAVLARPEASGFELAFEYRRDLFDESTARRMAAHFRNLLERAVADPARPVHALDLLSRAERHQALAEERAFRDPAAGESVCDCLLQVACNGPDSVAVASDAATLSYREVLARSDRLAGDLQRRGIGRGHVVGVLMERSVHLPVAALGVLRAGAAYLPLDPSLPPERLGHMVEDAEARAVVVSEADAGAATALPPAVPRLLVSDRQGGVGRLAPGDGPDPEDLSYVIYTSGSSGRPKGVEVPHRGLANLTRWHRRAYRLGSRDRTGLLAGVGFDASVWETWAALTAGSVLEIPPPGVRTDPRAVIDWMTSRRVTVTFLATPLAEAALRLPWPQGGALRTLLTGGDRLRRRPAPDRPFTLVNHYGPTEASVVTTCAAVAPMGSGSGLPPIGRPIHGAEARILDRVLRPLPLGVPGELFVGGAVVGRGYRGRPGATAERFVPDPGRAAGARLYRTGDLVRRRPDGGIDFLGRSDDQVQVLGLRIELGEIEGVLSEHPSVEAAAATVFTQGERQSIAVFVVADRDAPEAGLRDHLATRLPAYMVPAHVVRVDRLPLTRNGKIDRAALPLPPALVEGAAFTPPRDPVEEVVAGIWSELLGGGPVGVESDFFELGGHSLLATECVAALSETFGVPMPLSTLFERPTVRGLAGALVADEAHTVRVEETARVLLEVAALSEDELEAHLGERGLPGTERSMENRSP